MAEASPRRDSTSHSIRPRVQRPSTKAEASTSARPAAGTEVTVTIPALNEGRGFNLGETLTILAERPVTTTLNEGRGFNLGETRAELSTPSVSGCPQRRPRLQPRRDPLAHDLGEILLLPSTKAEASTSARLLFLPTPYHLRQRLGLTSTVLNPRSVSYSC